jgi:predicted MFS family arabinose efflux permease
MGFYQTWLHTFLVKGRAFTEHDLSWSALPYLFGAAGNLLGGIAVDWVAKRAGVRWSRRGVGIAGLLAAGVSIAAVFLTTSHFAVIACLSLAYFGITFQQPAVFAACADIGGTRSGAVTGMMNTAGQVGYATSSFVFGYLVKVFGNYNAPLLPMAAMLAAGMLLWWRVDVTTKPGRDL